jgi:transcriptional regulator with XRE-family HTH domain
MLTSMPKQKEPGSPFGARLIALRKARGLTQTQLAEAINTTQRAISYYECEGGNPDLDVIAQLAKALNVTTDHLLGTKAQPRIDSPALDPEARRYWRRFQQLMQLPEKDQRAVFRTLDTMTKASKAGKSKTSQA